MQTSETERAVSPSSIKKQSAPPTREATEVASQVVAAMELTSTSREGSPRGPSSPSIRRSVHPAVTRSRQPYRYVKISSAASLAIDK